MLYKKGGQGEDEEDWSKGENQGEQSRVMLETKLDYFLAWEASHQLTPQI